MPAAEQLSSDIQSDLIRRHKAAAVVVRALLVFTVFLSLMAFMTRSHLHHNENETLDRALRITILIFGLGAVILRRTRFSETRLQDTVALKGASGLLESLASTTLQVALLGTAMTIFGFLATVLTGNDFYSYGAGFVGFVVLLYGYPVRSSWERTLQRLAPSSIGTRTSKIPGKKKV